MVRSCHAEASDPGPCRLCFKANNASAANAFVRSEADLDWPRLERLANGWLRLRYGHNAGEWVYSCIRPQLLVEPFVGRVDRLPVDFKLWLFHGRVEFIQVDTARETQHKRCFYDRNWVKQPFGLGYPLETAAVARPVSLARMIEAAETLAAGMDCVRVDFYEVDDRPLFGEMTFYPGSGREVFTDEHYEYELGKLWRH